MKDPKIMISFTCEACLGHRIVQHPLWREFFEEFYPKIKDRTADARDGAEEMWWSEHGYADGYTPSEEIPCGDCEGDGTQRELIPLRHLAVLLDKYGEVAS